MPQSSHEGMTPNAIPMDGVQSNAETAAAQRTRAQAELTALTPSPVLNPSPALNSSSALNVSAEPDACAQAESSLQSDSSPQSDSSTQSEFSPQSDSGAVLDPAALTQAQAKARAQARKLQQLKLQAHATAGAAARFYPAPEGREEVPLLSSEERDLFFRFYPVTARQVTSIGKKLRLPSNVQVTQPDGSIQSFKLKSATHDDRLALSVAVKVVKRNLRSSLVDRAVDYIFAPAGITREQHVSTRAQLDDLAPRHLIAWSRESDLAVHQDAVAEAQNAWGDPSAAGFTVLDDTQPLKLNAALIKRLIQALGERRKRLPEILRPCIDDLIKFLCQMLPSQIPEFIKLVLGWLKLSSKELLAALLAFGRHLPDNFAFVACVHPSAYQQCGQDIHKLLQSFVLEPKKRAQSKRSQAKRKAASAKTNTSTGTPRKQRSSQQAPGATATAADSATASATTSKAQAAAQPTAATQPMAAPPTAPYANSVHLELEDLMDLAAADQQSDPTAAPTLVPERAVAPHAAHSQPAALSGDVSADTSVPVTASGEPDGAAGPTSAPTEPFAAQAETPVPAAQSGASAPMAPMAPASDADVSALSADADDDDADDEEIEQVVAQLLARVEVQAELSATRKKEQHERKQRKADHKRERKQRQAQRRRK